MEICAFTSRIRRIRFIMPTVSKALVSLSSNVVRSQLDVERTWPWKFLPHLQTRLNIPFLPSASKPSSTEPRKSLGTWLREISSCSSLTFLPGPAWVLLSKICQDFFSALYIATFFLQLDCGMPDVSFSEIATHSWCSNMHFASTPVGGWILIKATTSL